MGRLTRGHARGSVVALIVAALFIPAMIVMAGDRFTDVPNSNIFHNDINALALSGVTQGCGSGKYCPGASVTRGQMAAFLNRANALGGGTFPVSIAKPDLAAYCAIAAREPGSFPNGPCEGTTYNLDTNNVAQFSSVAIAPDGLPSIVYRSNFGDGMYFTHCLDVACSTFTDRLLIDAAAIGNISLAYGTDGLPIVAYTEEGSPWTVKVIHCGDPGCSLAGLTKTTVDEHVSNNYGEFTSMVIGSDGFPFISHQSPDAGELRVVHCTDVTCSTFDATGFAKDVGQGGQIALGADGKVVIPHGETAGDPTLSLTRCNDAACSAPTTQVLGTPAALQTPTAAVGTDGFPIVVYEGDDDDIYLIHCKNVSCSTMEGPTTVEAGDFESPRVAIGLDGFPILVYVEASTDDIHLADCSTLTCSASDITTVADDGPAGSGVFGFTVGIDGRAVISYENFNDGGLDVTRPAF